MIPVLLAAAYVYVAWRIARAIGRSIREADYRQQEPDWLWDQPTDVLSDAAVDARFREITAHFRVLS